MQKETAREIIRRRFKECLLPVNTWAGHVGIRAHRLSNYIGMDDRTMPDGAELKKLVDAMYSVELFSRDEWRAITKEIKGK